MSRVEIGLGFRSDKSTADYRVLARLAEGHGFDVLSVFGDLMYQPPIFPLLVMGQETSRVRLGPACLNPYSMSPYEIAGQLAALDMISQGRAFFGLARGSWLASVGLAQSRPVTTLREAVTVVRALLAGDDRGFAGEVFQLAPGTVLQYRPERPHLPLMLGAWGPRTVALAGEIADEVKIGGTANPAMVDVIRERLWPGALAAERDPADVGISMGAVTVVDEDGEAARVRARTEVAMYVGVVAELDPTIQVSAKILARLRHLLARNESHAAGRLIPDDLLDLFAFSGTPQKVAAQAQALIDAGVQRIEFGSPHGLDAKRGVELLGRGVVPTLRR